MPKITYVEYGGARHGLDVPLGENVMRGALYNNVAGIDGECGGALSCATCRCYVDDAWTANVGGPATHEERELLEAVAELDAGQAGRHVRLACQITLTEDLDGLVVRLPEHQHL